MALFCMLAAPPAQAAGWSEGAHMPTARAYAGAAILGNNLYVIGGGGTSGPRSMTEIYDIANKSWSLGAALPAGLQQFGIAVLGGKIYVAGGYKAADVREGTAEGETVELWMFDPSIGVWVNRTPMPGARSGFGLIAVGAKLYAVNGKASSIYVYDPSTDAWTSAKSSMPASRMGAAYAGLGDKIYVIGGAEGAGSTARVDVYDAVKDSWCAGAPLPSARQSLSAAVADDSIHVAGGQSVTPPKTYADHFVFKSGSWSKSSSMPTARHAAVATAAGGKFYVIGGSPGAGVYTVFTQTDVMEIWSSK